MHCFTLFVVSFGAFLVIIIKQMVIYHFVQHTPRGGENTLKAHEWDDRKCWILQDKDIIPEGAGCWYLTLYPEANYALYHILGALEAAGCALPSLNTDFRTGQCRYFFSGGNEFAYWGKAGHGAHTCWKQKTFKRASVSCVWNVLPTLHSELSGYKKGVVKASPIKLQWSLRGMSYLCEAQQKQKFQHLQLVMFLVPAGEMCDAAPKKMTSGKQLRLKLTFFPPPFALPLFPLSHLKP